MLTGLLKVQTFEVGTTAQIVNFIYELPEAILELDQVDLSLSIKMRTGSNLIVGPIISPNETVDIKTVRERFWTRVAGGTGGQEAVVSYSPSSYLTYDFYGSGLYGLMGEALNMGNVEVQIDGVVTKPSIDMFPQDLPEGSNPQVIVDTRYIKTQFLDTQEANAQHRLKLTLLPEKNPRALSTGLSLSGFTVEQYSSNTSKRIILRDILTTGHTDMILHSYPTPFDANLLAGQLGLSANLLELATQLDAELSGSNVFFTSTNTTGNTLSGNTTTDTTGNTITAGNTATVGTTGNTTAAKPSFKGVGLSASDALLVEVFDGQSTKAQLYSSTSGEKLNFTKGDQVHRMTLSVISPLGQARKSGELFYVPLAKPSIWTAGSDTFSLNIGSQPFTLKRTDTSSPWEVAVITLNQDDLSLPRGTKVLVVQKVGAFGVLDFSVSGPTGNYRSIQGESTQGSTVQLSKTNLVSLPDTLTGVATTLDTANSIANSSASLSESSGGGGGGCLLAH